MNFEGLISILFLVIFGLIIGVGISLLKIVRRRAIWIISLGVLGIISLGYFIFELINVRSY